MNLAVVWQFWVRRAEGRRREVFAYIVLPALGFVFCTVIWLGLGAPAKVAGGIWFVIGLFVLAVHTRGFQQAIVLPDPANYD